MSFISGIQGCGTGAIGRGLHGLTIFDCAALCNKGNVSKVTHGCRRP